MKVQKPTSQPSVKKARGTLKAAKAVSKAIAAIQGAEDQSNARPQRGRRQDNREAGNFAPLPLGPLAKFENEVPRIPNVKASKKSTQKRAHQMLPPSVLAYLNALSNPETSESAKGVFQVNNINSGPTCTLMQEANFDVTVTNGADSGMGTVTVGIFPGHSGVAPSDASDDVSTHQLLQGIGSLGNLYNVGPISWVNSTTGVTYPPVIGFFTGTLAEGATPTSTTLLSTSYIGPDVATPLTAYSALGSGHTRWRLTALALEWVNRTNAASINGQVEFVQPENKVQPPAPLNRVETYTYSRNYELLPPTYGRRVWFPRSDDWSYWHTTEGVAPTTSSDSYGSAGLLLFLTGLGQSYRLKVSYHWEIAGANVAFMATPEKNIPSADGYLLPAIEAVRQAPQNREQVPKVAAVMAASQDTGLSQFMHVAEGLANSFVPGSVVPLITKLLTGPIGDFVSSIL